MEGNTIGTILLIFTGLFTYKGLRDHSFMEAYLFDVDKILINKEYKRLISAGFLHANWFHFAFNMFALLSFGRFLEDLFKIGPFLLLYFVSMIGGNLLALYIHRNHGDYRALGASGAISGVIFSYIVLDPYGKIGFVLLPFELQSWLFGVFFILISIFAIKSKRDNIGHEAHLGGAIVGVLITTLFFSDKVYGWMVAAILVPTTAFLILIARNPAVLMVEKYWGENIETVKHLTRKRLETKRTREEELDDLLDKIRKTGMSSLTKKEKERLEELTNKM